MAGTLGTLKVKDTNGAWVNIAGRGPIGPKGDPGIPGPPFIVVANFGTSKTPADLPVNGTIPVDWDEPGDPAYQMVLGNALYYEPTNPVVTDAGHLYEFVDTMDPTGWIDAGMIRGPAGPTGVSTVIIGDFGATTTPADLPPDGLLPVDWDGPGNPAVAYQMELGYSLYYDKPGDPLDGHLFQFVSDAVDPTGWLDIGLIQGPTGPPGPQGNPGVGLDEVFVGPLDPIATVPSADVWYDTLAPEPPPVGMPDYVLKAGIFCKSLRGPWNGTGTAAATFTAMPAGTYMLMAGGSGYTTTAGFRQIDVKMDGTTVLSVGLYFNALSIRHQMGPQIALVTIPAGDHLFSLHVGTSLLGDNNEYGFVYLIPVGA